MARRKVIVKHLPAIQNLGSIDVLCSDKTGTLTSGVMKLDRSLDSLGKESEYTRFLGYLNSKFETGIRNPLNLAIHRICSRVASPKEPHHPRAETSQSRGWLFRRRH